MNNLTKMYVWMLTFFTPLRNKKGQGLVEYALILVLLVAIVIAAITMLKGGTTSAFNTVVNSLNSPQ